MQVWFFMKGKYILATEAITQQTVSFESSPLVNMSHCRAHTDFLKKCIMLSRTALEYKNKIYMNYVYE